MRLETSLYQRGLWMLALPIACQILFVGYLFSVLSEVQETTSRERQSYQLIRDTYGCYRTATEELVFTGLSFAKGEDARTSDNRLGMQVISKTSERLAEKIEKIPQQSQNAKDLRVATSKLAGLLSDSWASADGLRPGTNATQLKKSIQLATFEYMGVLTKIVSIEQRQNAGDIIAANKSIRQLVLVFIIAPISTVALALYLARYYYVSISKPLAHLTKSGELLSQLKTLPTPLESSSREFIQVDKLIHLVSNEVEGALTREKEVVVNAISLICSLDSDEVFQEANPYAKRMLGYFPEDMVGKHLSEFAIGADLIEVIETLRSTVHSGSLATFELTMRHKDGSGVETKWSCAYSSSHRKFFCIVDDITDEKRAEQLRIDFSDTVSQDLRNPLISIQQILGSIKNGSHGAVSHEVAATLNKTSRNVDRLVLLANELLDFQKIKGGKIQLTPEPADLSQIVQEAVDTISIMADPKKITLRLPKGSHFLECDRTKILQTVVNLLSNAIKFSPMNSTIEIVIRESSGREQAPRLELQVIDAGPGIPADYQQRIFEPFEQVPGAQAKLGTGLGLAICKLICEAHGGSIAVATADPSRGTGSIFTIKLPKIPRMS